MKINELPSLENLNKWFTLDESTGTLYWKEKKAYWTKVGTEAGGIGSKGYKTVKFDGVSTRIHRIVYKMYYGVEPIGEIDHIDGNILNNKIDNLRLASRPQNRHNVKKNNNNTSGHKNVYWRQDSKKWRVMITAFGKVYHFGCYFDIEDAVSVAEKERKVLHGEFAVV